MPPGPVAPRLTADLVRGLEIRNLTGTFSSGRIAEVAVDPRNRSIGYVASASGGLCKTTNHRLTFSLIFDDGGSYSLGCVTFDPRNPDVVWLGAGENQSQRAIGWGDGVYKSTDAGRTWKRMGLAHSEHIAKILIANLQRNRLLPRQGDNLASPNPPMGALRTYYLRNALPNARPVLTITDSEGKLVRRLDASNSAGLHRTPWDLRETAPPAPTGRRGRAGRGLPGGEAAPARGGGRGGRLGALVQPGTYKVALGKLVDGVVVPIGQPTTVEVGPLEPSNR